MSTVDDNIPKSTTVTVEVEGAAIRLAVDHDAGLTIGYVTDYLIMPALLAAGFSAETVRRGLGLDV